MKTKLWILGLFALVVWAGCGDDDSTGGGEPVKPVDIDGALVVPAAWAGTWEITLTFRDCSTNDILSQEVITSQVCPGDTLVNPFVDIFGDCTGTRTGSHLEASCEYQNSNGACQVTMSLDFTMDVSGNSLTGSGTIQTTATPACGDLFTDGCQKVGISGTRLSTDVSDCGSAAASLNPFLR